MVRNLAFSLWQICDPFYYRCTRLQRLDTHPQQVFRVRLLRYRGQTLTLYDGTRIEQGDLLVKLHLHNVRLFRMLGEEHPFVRARKLQNLVAQSLPAVSQYILQHRRSLEIKGVIGFTQLNRGCRQLGFDVWPIASRGYRLLKWLGLIPIFLLFNSQPLHARHKFEPKILAMSRTTLFDRYPISNI
jgi:hypothetical protein